MDFSNAHKEVHTNICGSGVYLTKRAMMAAFGRRWRRVKYAMEDTQNNMHEQALRKLIIFAETGVEQVIWARKYKAKRKGRKGSA